MRSAAGSKRVKKRTSVTRPRATRVSSTASTSAAAYTNAESQASKGSIPSDGLEEEDEKYSSQDRDIPRKRAREMAEDTDSDSSSQVNEGITWRYGGIESEDDDCGYRAVMLGERHDISLKMTDGGTTTIIPPRTYKPPVEKPRLPIRRILQMEVTNFGLPHGIDDNDDWYKKFIPTYKKWLGTRAKPWIIDEDENIAALQVIWRAVYPHIDYVIDGKCSVYHLATHRLDDWRGSIDYAAIDMFKSRYEDLGFSSKESTLDASKLLQNNRFRYAETTGKTQKEYHGLFRSPFILALIAGYYDSISTAIRIPELERAFSRDERKLVKYLETKLRSLDADSREALEIAVKLDTMRMCPKGALAVCITAVEHALGIFAPAGGALFQRHSDKWTEKVQKYSDIVERKLKPSSMEDIVLKACPFMDPGTNISSISVQVLNDSDDEENSSGG